MRRYGPSWRLALLPILLFGVLTAKTHATPAEPGPLPAAEELIGVWAGVRRFGPVAEGTLTLELPGNDYRVLGLE